MSRVPFQTSDDQGVVTGEDSVEGSNLSLVALGCAGGVGDEGIDLARSNRGRGLRLTHDELFPTTLGLGGTWMMGVGEREGMPRHPEGNNALTAEEIETINLWVLLGAQYK